MCAAQVGGDDRASRRPRARAPGARRCRRRRSRRTRRRPGARASRARAGSRTSSPGRHGRPCGRKTCSNPDPRPIAPRLAAACASTARMNPSQAGKPRRASSIAGARTSARDSRPNRAWASPHERTAPGTVIVSGPRSGRRLEPARPQRRRIGRRRRPPGAVQRVLAALGRRPRSARTRRRRSRSTTARRPPATAFVGDRRVDRRAAGAQDRRGPASVARWWGATTAPRAPRASGAGTRTGHARRSPTSVPVIARPGARARRRSAPGAGAGRAGRSAISSSPNVAEQQPVDAAPVGRDAADQAARDLADGEEDAVQAHDRAAVGREPLGDVGQQAERRRRRAGQDEQPERGGQRRPTIGTTSGSPSPWLIATPPSDEDRRRRRSRTG